MTREGERDKEREEGKEQKLEEGGREGEAEGGGERRKERKRDRHREEGEGGRKRMLSKPSLLHGFRIGQSALFQKETGDLVHFFLKKLPTLLLKNNKKIKSEIDIGY